MVEHPRGRAPRVLLENRSHRKAFGPGLGRMAQLEFPMRGWAKSPMEPVPRRAMLGA